MKQLTISGLVGRKTHHVEKADALEFMRRLPDRSVSLVFFSPPYEEARTYGTGFKLKGEAWVAWLRPIILEAARVSAGFVAVNMAARVRKCSYSAAVEWLVADLTRGCGLVCGPSPYCWIKSEDYDDADGNGTPGSGGPYYHRRDWEPIYCFARPDRLPGNQWGFYSDPLAFGRAPKWGAGGEFSNRDQNGKRVNEKFHKAPGPMTIRNGGKNAGQRGWAPCTDHATGEMVTRKNYAPPPISNPGNILRVPVGGGKMGCPVAHDGEAPMALGVAERFVIWYCPLGCVVLDPFCGTGTTGHAAVMHGRRFIGCDNRQSQVKLTKRRLRNVRPQVNPRSKPK